MRDPELEQDCPALTTTPYEIKSPRDPQYNCVAFAIGDVNHFWYDIDISGYYWPPGAPSADTLSGWIAVFQLHGYEDTDDDSLEVEYEKIAIYTTADGPEHVARQTASAMWASKIGKGADIEHSSLSALEGTLLGKVTKIMKRKCKDGKRVFE
jgi:hypothetical protein